MFKKTFISLINQRQLIIRQYARRSSNPGIDNRLNMFKKENIKAEKVDEYDDDFEADFHNINKSHKMYEKESEIHRENVKKWIVKNKYFKTKDLNFLTWSEKEQIRYLHQQEPEEWSPEKLSESFPATIETIKKVIKSSWTPQDSKRIEKHDKSVKESWDLFKSNQIPDMERSLQEHLRKFAQRSFFETCAPKVDQSKLIIVNTPQMSTEFSSIITSCKKYAETETAVKQIEDIQQEVSHLPRGKFIIPDKQPKNDMFLLDNVQDKRPRTFQQMAEQLNTVISVDDDDDDRSINTKLSSRRETEEINLDKNYLARNLIKNKYQTNLPQVESSNNNTVLSSPIKEHIKIPKRLWKRGATYKIKDCFYDDDGEFLYRVPGMTGN